jgi:hypothetical protein
MPEQQNIEYKFSFNAGVLEAEQIIDANFRKLIKNIK